MRILIAEDDLDSRRFMRTFLSSFGECDIAVNGLEAVDKYLLALKGGAPYSLICMDIMMPMVDGIKALKAIRRLEREEGVRDEERVKIIMTTALNDKKAVAESYDSGCEAYVWKPIDTAEFTGMLKNLGLIE